MYSFLFNHINQTKNYNFIIHLALLDRLCRFLSIQYRKNMKEMQQSLIFFAIKTNFMLVVFLKVSSTLHLHISHTSPAWFHSVTPSCCSTWWSLPFPSPPPPPCAAWSRVWTCKLPLFWVSLIQFSGRYKPAMFVTPSPPTNTCPGHKMCWQHPMVLKVPTDGPLPPK